jgi:tripartite-type tricarboxylate transporter receptor subunit TctC
MKHLLKRFLAIAAATALAFVAPAAFAQAFPVKAIKGVVSAAPGGGNDFVARVLAPHISENLKQPFIVENRGGAGGVVGTDFVAKAAPDGYTLAMCFVNFAIFPSLYRKLPFDPINDFAPISTLAGTPLILVVHPSLPVLTIKQLVALARSRPGALNVASTGAGSVGHLAGELFKVLTGTSMVPVPYNGGAPAITALLSGEVQLYFATVPAALAQVKAGRLRALAVTSAKRIGLEPGLPTIAEAGVPGYDVTGWFGLLAPARTPRAIITHLNIEVNNALRIQDVRDRFATEGLEPLGSTPEEFASTIKNDIEKWARVAQSAGIKRE